MPCRRAGAAWSSVDSEKLDVWQLRNTAAAQWATLQTGQNLCKGAGLHLAACCFHS